MGAGNASPVDRQLQRRRRLELAFVVAGLLCLTLAMLTLLTLFADMARQGLPRLSVAFLTG